MSLQLQNIYETRKVIGKSGAEIELHSEVDPAEGEFLHNIICQDSTISRTLEVGCACGLSSLHICDALRSRAHPQHIIIDPFQSSDWDGVGIRNLEEAGFDFFKLIEKPSELALPELLSRGESSIDLIFIDGWHTFDHTLLDCFYATRLLRVGGYLLIDDVNIEPVRRATDYLSLYPCYEVFAAVSAPASISLKQRLAKTALSALPPPRRKQIANPALVNRVFSKASVRMLAFKKVADDRRPWDWYPDNF